MSRKESLEWLGHLSRMDDHRLPKTIIFGWLSQHHPADETKTRLCTEEHVEVPDCSR